MEILRTTVGHHLSNMLPEGIAFTVAAFLEEGREEKKNRERFESWHEWVLIADRKGERRMFPRYTGNLKYGAFFVYSYGREVIEIDYKHRTVKRLGKWTPSTSKHMNYAIRTFTEHIFGFMEIK